MHVSSSDLSWFLPKLTFAFFFSNCVIKSGFVFFNLLAGDDHRHDHHDDKDVENILHNPVAAERIVG